MTEIVVDDSVAEGYDAVRDDSNDQNWAVFAYADDVSEGDANTIVFQSSGSGGYDEFAATLAAWDGKRAYGFLRQTSGDELSARAKFVFVSWVPDNTPIRKRAAVSTHKGFVKDVVKDFAIELHATDMDDMSLQEIQKCLQKAGGANYGSSSS